MAQKRYGFSTPVGVAGGIYDLSPYAIDTFVAYFDPTGETAEEDYSTVVPGGTAFRNVDDDPNHVVPTGSSDGFLGIVVHKRTLEHGIDGGVKIRPGDAVGVMRYGKVYVRLAEGAEPTVGEAVYADDGGSGYVTNSGSVKIPARFLTGKDPARNIALIELYNQDPTIGNA